MPLVNKQSASLTWLGVAGLVFDTGTEVLAIDPFLTRPKLSTASRGGLEPDLLKIRTAVPRCDYIFISHAHHDHLMDVPTVMEYTRAQVYAPPNACKLLVAMGVEQDRVHPVLPNVNIQLGSMKIGVLPGSHIWLPLPVFGDLPDTLHHPPHILEYKMDMALSFLIDLQGIKLAFAPSQSVEADIIFSYPYRQKMQTQNLRANPPKIIVPIHWDNLFQPLMEANQNPHWIELQLLNRFKRRIRRVIPGTEILILNRFEKYSLQQLL